MLEILFNLYRQSPRDNRVTSSTQNVPTTRNSPVSPKKEVLNNKINEVRKIIHL